MLAVQGLDDSQAAVGRRLAAAATNDLDRVRVEMIGDILPVHLPLSALVEHGHGDLADAFASTGERHSLSKNDEHTMQALASHFSPSARTLENIRKVAGRLGWLDQTLGQLRDRKLGGPFAAPSGYSYDPVGMRNAGKKLGDVIDEYHAAASAREAKKEAA